MNFYRILMFCNKSCMVTKGMGYLCQTSLFKVYYFVPTPEFNKNKFRGAKRWKIFKLFKN